MSTPSTKTLDHIIHLTPPGTVDQVSQQFRDLGFNVIHGGTHTGGLTANALVLLADGAYLELISFTHPASHYPPGSPDRLRRDANPWAHKEPGWIDFAFLGSATTSIARIINARAEQDGSGIRYTPETHGGRTRPDGHILKWVISATEDEQLRGSVPFFCGDITPRQWRVPIGEPPSNTIHPSGARGVAYIRILADPGSVASVSSKVTSVIGEPPRFNTTESEYTWTLDAPSDTLGPRPRFSLSVPMNNEEQEYLGTRGAGIFEVGFSVGQDGAEGESSTPYGKIVWVKSP